MRYRTRRIVSSAQVLVVRAKATALAAAGRLWLLAALLAVFAPVHAERVKDLANIQGVRPNQLVGYGLVVGLDGTGDQTTQTPFTVQSLLAMLSQLGANIPIGTNLQLKNVASVMIPSVPSDPMKSFGRS